MELKQNSIIVSDRLQALFDFELRSCFTHAFVTDGECVMKYSGEEVRMVKGDCVIIIANHLVTEILPTENFHAKVIFIEPGFMEACTPHTSYGIVGGMSLFINPVMHLDERDQWLCEHDFDEIIRRIRQPHQSFQGDAVMAATQMMFCDFYEFHAHLYGQPEISALTASVMKRFFDLLERGDYRRNRDVAYYADKLCVTPKYLSEVSKKLSGRTAGRSDGATTDMSIRTEESDLRAVIGHFAEDSRVDASRIYLVGASQGGMVTAMTAADYPDLVRAAVLIYPALVIPDDVHEWYPRREDIPATFSLWGVTLGSIYATDAYDYDIYTELPKFQKDVLIIHGTADNIASISYSERMAELYASAELKRIEGAGHGFYGQQQTQAIDWMLDFLNAEEQKAAAEDEPQDEGADANVISARENVKK